MQYLKLQQNFPFSLVHFDCLQFFCLSYRLINKFLLNESYIQDTYDLTIQYKWCDDNAYVYCCLDLLELCAWLSRNKHTMQW